MCGCQLETKLYLVIFWLELKLTAGDRTELQRLVLWSLISVVKLPKACYNLTCFHLFFLPFKVETLWSTHKQAKVWYSYILGSYWVHYRNIFGISEGSTLTSTCQPPCVFNLVCWSLWISFKGQNCYLMSHLFLMDFVWSCCKVQSIHYIRNCLSQEFVCIRLLGGFARVQPKAQNTCTMLREAGLTNDSLTQHQLATLDVTGVPTCSNIHPPAIDCSVSTWTLFKTAWCEILKIIQKQAA